MSSSSKVKHVQQYPEDRKSHHHHLSNAKRQPDHRSQVEVALDSGSAEVEPAYSTQEHAAPGVFSQYSTRQDFGLCTSVQAHPWMK